jgi:FAD-dependent urate hydroxylase
VNSDKAAGPIARLIRDSTFPIAMRIFYSQENMTGWIHRYSIDWAAPVSAVPALTIR